MGEKKFMEVVTITCFFTYEGSDVPETRKHSNTRMRIQ